MDHEQRIDQEIANVLLSISKVAKRLAGRFAKDAEKKGEDNDGKHEESLTAYSRVGRTH